MVKEFERGKKYRVVKPWTDDNTICLSRLKMMRYDLVMGEILRFRGKNLDMAEFLDDQGKLVLLPPRVAFEIMDYERGKEEMAHILENAKSDKTFTMGEMIEEKITSLAVRMDDARGFIDADNELINAWRNELFAIRNAVHAVMAKPGQKPTQPEPPKTTGVP